MDEARTFSVGDKITQFIETTLGAMGMINGRITSVENDKIVFIAEGNEDESVDGTERIVTLEWFETII